LLRDLPRVAHLIHKRGKLTMPIRAPSTAQMEEQLAEVTFKRNPTSLDTIENLKTWSPRAETLKNRGFPPMVT
jgi:hypothetical protein